MTRSASGIFPPYRGHISLGEFGVPVLLSKRVAKLCHHVMQVLFLGTSEQVARIATNRIVAAVTHHLATLQVAVYKNVRHAMRATWGRISDCETAVAMFINMGEPRPAGVRVTDANLLPKKIAMFMGIRASLERLRECNVSHSEFVNRSYSPVN